MNNTASLISTAFFGTPEFAAVVLERLITVERVNVKVVITQPDSAAGRGNKIHHSAVYDLATKHNIPILQPDSIKRAKAQFLNALAGFGQIDVSIVAAFGQIIPKEVLDYAKSGSVNIHASLLPRWRGAAPIQRAILSGDTDTGVCLMKMEAGLDTGPVYSRANIPILADDSAGSLHDKLAVLGSSLLAKDLNAIVTGKILAEAQLSAEITYATKITNEECEIDWNTTNTLVNRQIRALSPLPGAFTFINGKRLKIYRASLKEGVLHPAIAGTVVTVDRDRLEVQCASGLLSLSEVQLQDRKRMNIEDFLRGMSIELGTKLGGDDPMKRCL